MFSNDKGYGFISRDDGATTCSSTTAQGRGVHEPRGGDAAQLAMLDYDRIVTAVERSADLKAGCEAEGGLD